MNELMRRKTTIKYGAAALLKHSAMNYLVKGANKPSTIYKQQGIKKTPSRYHQGITMMTTISLRPCAIIPFYSQTTTDISSGGGRQKSPTNNTQPESTKNNSDAPLHGPFSPITCTVDSLNIATTKYLQMTTAV